MASYRKAVELAPEKEELRYGLATILLQAGRDEESLPIFRQVFRDHPVWVEITKRNVKSGDLPNNPARIQRVLDQAAVREQR
jgi:Flp pilus assembly protein TadD